MIKFFAIAVLLAAAGLFVAEPASAEGGKLGLELNRIQTVKAGCRVSMVVRNETGAPIETAQFEIVFFDTSELVDTVTALDLGGIPPAKTRVVQFDLPKRKCGEFSRLLINRTLACRGGRIDDANCLGLLDLSNRTKLQFNL